MCCQRTSSVTTLWPLAWFRTLSSKVATFVIDCTEHVARMHPFSVTAVILYFTPVGTLQLIQLLGLRCPSKKQKGCYTSLQKAVVWFPFSIKTQL